MELRQSTRTIDEIIVHCTATPEGKDFTVQQIRDWHVKGNGWRDIGYHFVVYRNGDVMPGRPIAQPGAHCAGHNAHSIGVCYVGGCDTEDGSAAAAEKAESRIPPSEDTRTPRLRQQSLSVIRCNL